MRDFPWFSSGFPMGKIPRMPPTPRRHVVAKRQSAVPGVFVDDVNVMSTCLDE